MLIPVQRLQCVPIENAAADHLLWSVAGGEPTLFWIVENDGQRIAMFLTGTYAGQGFKIGSGSPWPGVQVGPVELRIDVSSAHDGGGSEVGLRAADGKLTTSVRMERDGFMQPTRIVVAYVATVQDQSLYFARWSLGILEGDDWKPLVNCDGSKMSGPLVPPAAGWKNV